MNEGKIKFGGFDTSRCNSANGNEIQTGGRNILARSMSVRPARRRAKTVGLLLVFVVAVVIVSAMALMPLGRSKTANPDVPAGVEGPGPAYYVTGYTYDASEVKLPSCEVNVTNLETLEWNVTTSTDPSAYYMVNINGPSFPSGYHVGDRIYVIATKGVMYGENQSVVAGGALVMNVTLNLVIPEFPSIVVPIGGMMVLFAAVGLISRRDGKAT